MVLALCALVMLLVLVSALVLPPMMLAVPENPVSRTPTDVGLAYSEVELAGPAVPLPGWWIPAREPGATLVFVHGGGSSRTSTLFQSLDFYRAIHDAGINILTFDIRNHGNAPPTDSLLHMGQVEWRDLNAALERVAHLEGANPPYLVMGISMGGATAIHALANGVEADGWILLDPVLDNRDVLAHAAAAQTGLPTWLYRPAAWFATQFHGVASGNRQPLALAAAQRVPLLLLQDPDDPVTRARFSRHLALANPDISFHEAPATPATAGCLADKAGWGSHVSAFHCHRDWTLTRILDFVEGVKIRD